MATPKQRQRADLENMLARNRQALAETVAANKAAGRPAGENIAGLIWAGGELVQERDRLDTALAGLAARECEPEHNYFEEDTDDNALG